MLKKLFRDSGGTQARAGNTQFVFFFEGGHEGTQARAGNTATDCYAGLNT